MFNFQRNIINPGENETKQLPESNLMSVRVVEDAQPPVCLGGAGVPSGMA